MAKKQTRRSVSVSKKTYEKLKAHCELNGLSMSEFTEGAIENQLARIAMTQVTNTKETDNAEAVARV